MSAPDAREVADKEGIFPLGLALFEVNVGQLLVDNLANGGVVHSLGKRRRYKRSSVALRILAHRRSRHSRLGCRECLSVGAAWLLFCNVSCGHSLVGRVAWCSLGPSKACWRLSGWRWQPRSSQDASPLLCCCLCASERTRPVRARRREGAYAAAPKAAYAGRKGAPS